MKKLKLSIPVLFALLLIFIGQATAQISTTQSKLDEREFNRQFKHQTARVNGVKLHYVRGGTGDPLVLLHGFPQTWHEWKRVMPALARKHTVIAVDLRGAGDSDKPANGYDKKTMATDVRELVKQLGFPQVNLVGHDIGLMVAYAYAAQYPSEVKKLAVIDAPLPGTKTFEGISRDPRAWHFSFNSDVDFATNLTGGKERIYLQHFYDKLSANKEAISKADVDEYTRAYSKPGAMRAGFEWYRAFETDTKDNREFLKTKLKMPVLGMNGAFLTPGQTESYIAVMMRDAAENVRGALVPNAGHWLAEEQPEKLTQILLAFFDEQ